jgi:hypothetical protein
VLLDPLEKQLHVPAAAIEIGNSFCWKDEIVGQKHECFVLFGIEVADTSQFVGIVLFGIVSLEDNNLVAVDPGGFVHRLRIEAPPAEIGF